MTSWTSRVNSREHHGPSQSGDLGPGRTDGQVGNPGAPRTLWTQRFEPWASAGMAFILGHPEKTWGKYLVRAQDIGRTIRTKGERALETTIESHWPAIQQVFREKVAPLALSLAKNDEGIKYASEIVYQALPSVVRVLVRQETFVRICLANRDRILAAWDSAPPPGEEPPLSETPSPVPGLPSGSEGAQNGEVVHAGEGSPASC